MKLKLMRIPFSVLEVVSDLARRMPRSWSVRVSDLEEALERLDGPAALAAFPLPLNLPRIEGYPSEVALQPCLSYELALMELHRIFLTYTDYSEHPHSVEAVTLIGVPVANLDALRRLVAWAAAFPLSERDAAWVKDVEALTLVLEAYALKGEPVTSSDLEEVSP